MATDEGIISVSAFRRGDIAADRAVLGIVIEGASLVTGQSALHKAREVRTLAEALKAFGLLENAIELEGVAASTSSGTFNKSSSARYTLRVKVGDLEALPDVIGIITSQKNTSVRPVEWGFPDDGEWRNEWLDSCLQNANTRAERVASGLRVPLLGVHRFVEAWSDAVPPPRIVAPAPADSGDLGDFESREMLRAPRARMGGEDLGLSISHTKKVSLSIAVQYVVGRFESERQAKEN